MRSVLRLKIAFLFFTILITVCVISCGEDDGFKVPHIEVPFEIYNMSIEEVNISVSEIDKEVYDLTGCSEVPLFSVIVWVFGIAGPSSCYGHHKTDYLHRDDFTGHPLYRNWDTINIYITASGPADPGFCSDEVGMHEEAIFVGFCEPGEYRLHVNGFTKMFCVGSDL